MLEIVKKFVGTKNDREVKRYRSLVSQVNDFEKKFDTLADEEIAGKTGSFRERVANGETLHSLLPEAFSLCRVASKRVLQMRHFDVQLIGGMVLNDGRIAEMKTGEGKTLTATLAVYLNALSGQGVHVVTVNDYLARRDSEWMGQLYQFLGLSTGLIVHGLNDTERKAGYQADITYGTNNEFGFDFLRDNMKTDLDRYVQRKHAFCIVDEVDSILIDEARTPLIISGPAETSTEVYVRVNTAIPGLQKDSDYIIDEKSRTAVLTDDGITKMEKRLGVQNLYDPNHISELHHVQQALKAHVLFKKDVDYVVKDSQVIIVDEFTGRLMPGRRYSDGLHGALEAKEHLKVENETQVLASITFQNYFRLYEKLSGMTGTADTEAVEFKKIYGLDVVVVPTNKQIIRADHDDEIYKTALEKFNVIADEIAVAQKKGQPVLVGTVSVERSELLSALLRKRGIPHETLNAKNHGREASIIADAGKKGHVTISTNMAGRGTDIVLGEGVRELGGLYVIGTERHESRRIDNQLRGRSGRQGDPGVTKFYLSLEDDLMRIFASDRLAGIMNRLGMKEGEPIVSPMVSKAIERAQKRVEEQNFSSRKHVLEYDDVMNQQRKVIYDIRYQVLSGEASLDFFQDSVKAMIDKAITNASPDHSESGKWKHEQLTGELAALFNLPTERLTLISEDLDQIDSDSLSKDFHALIVKCHEDKFHEVPSEIRKRIESFVYLQIIDQAWKDHLRNMEALQDSVRLRGYGQRDPLQEYKKEAFKLFEELIYRIEDDTVLHIIQMPPPQISGESIPQNQGYDETKINLIRPEVAGPDSTEENPENLIYHGTREREASEQRPETFVRDGKKVGRNDPCPCGSGRKYKKCHGAPTTDG